MISTHATSLSLSLRLTQRRRQAAQLGMAVATLAIAAGLSGCAAPAVVKDVQLLNLLKPYRIDILQGNVVTREQAALLKPGLNRTQVRDLLGSPMLADPFHANRWDYVFVFQRPGQAAVSRSLIAIFEGDTLDSVQIPDGDLPSETEFVSTLAPAPGKKASPPPPLELTPAQRDALIRARPAAATSPAEPATTGSVRKSYPPLEP